MLRTLLSYQKGIISSHKIEKDFDTLRFILTLRILCIAGMSFDNAIRSFLESFRLPGEAQKINRIVESFGTYYHMQCPKLFKNADAVYIFAYSVILLNTDQHNHQVNDLNIQRSLLISPTRNSRDN